MSAKAAGIPRLVVAACLLANERRLSAVAPHVELQQRLGGGGVATDAAAVTANFVVQDPLVDPQRLYRAEHFGAGWADMRPEPLGHRQLGAVVVYHAVVQKLGQLPETFITLGADKTTLANV